MEGIAAIAIVFILFTVLTQAATALIAHRAAQSAVAASAARVAIDPASAEMDVDRLGADLGSIVPGARDFAVHVEVGARVVTVSASFRFVPPGPAFRDITMEVKADAPIVVEP